MIAALALCASAAPAGAGDRVAIVGCDLLAQGGPTATFLQIAGESRKQRSGFVFRSGDTSEDVTGRSCAKVLADLTDDGFEFRDASVSGPPLNELVSIWQDDD
jgi:hypothetical protein